MFLASNSNRIPLYSAKVTDPSVTAQNAQQADALAGFPGGTGGSGEKSISFVVNA
jgi:hypothetical protein